MTECNTLNIKLSNSQLNELKLGIKNDTRSYKFIIKCNW